MRVVEQPPGQDSGRIVQEQVPRDQQEEGGDDGGIETGEAGLRRGPGLCFQPYFPLTGVTVTRAPQEQTRLLTAHSIFSKRPQAEQAM